MTNSEKLLEMTADSIRHTFPVVCILLSSILLLFSTNFLTGDPGRSNHSPHFNAKTETGRQLDVSSMLESQTNSVFLLFMIIARTSCGSLPYRSN